MNANDIIKPCPHCGAELYDRSLYDLDKDKPICFECKKCVRYKCKCEDHKRI